MVAVFDVSPGVDRVSSAALLSRTGHELVLYPQGSEVVDQVLHTVSKSNSLEELTLENAGLKS